MHATETVEVGRTGLRVTRLGLGGVALSGAPPATDPERATAEKEAVALIRENCGNRTLRRTKARAANGKRRASGIATQKQNALAVRKKKTRSLRRWPISDKTLTGSPAGSEVPCMC